MLSKARHAAREAVEFREGYGEELPVPDDWADVVISNGLLNLMPDKSAALEEMARILKSTGRLQIADILVQKAVPMAAKCQIDLWSSQSVLNSGNLLLTKPCSLTIQHRKRWQITYLVPQCQGTRRTSAEGS
jgi:ubiquinone/menaquinone biosynthesis C-methylase UbiE